MSATEASLDVMERENTPKRSAERGAQLRAHLDALKDKYKVIGDVRGMGLMQGIELVEDRKTKEPAPKRTNQLLDAAKKHGLLIGKGGLYSNVIRIAPSMLVSADEVDDAAVRLDKAFAEIS
jgi:4-aminobutyrate aminotransferase-like enzyme